MERTRLIQRFDDYRKAVGRLREVLEAELFLTLAKKLEEELQK